MTPPSSARQRVIAGVGLASTLTTVTGTLIPIPASAALPACPSTAAFTAAVNAIEAASPAVRSADALLATRKKTLTSAAAAERTAYAAYVRARASKVSAAIAAALKVYDAAHARTLAASSAEVAAAKADATVRAAVRTAAIKKLISRVCLATPGSWSVVAGNDQVSMSWTAVAHATSYLIIRNGIPYYRTTGRSYVDTKALNGYRYTYTVQAWGPTGTSAQSAARTVTPMLPSPAHLTVTPGNGSAQISWLAVPHATLYTLMRDGVAVATTTGTSITDTGLANGSTYYYQVVASAGPALSPATTQVGATPVLPAPTGVVASSGDAQVQLTWSAVPNASGYVIYRDGLVIGTSTAASYTDVTAANAQSYTYAVQSVEGSVLSALSSDASATPVLPAPSGVSATGIDMAVDLSWTAVAHATSYLIFRDGVQVGTSSTTTYQDTGLVNNQSYAYTVEAVDPTGTSVPSASVGGSPELTPPTGIAGTPGNARATLTWNAVAGATGYLIFANGILVGATSGLTFTDTSPSNGTTYAYTIESLQGAILSAPSAPVDVTPVSPPSAPTGVTATAGSTQVLISWTAVAGATSYQVFRNSSLVGTVTTTSFTDAGLTNGTSYSYKVRAVNAGGSSYSSSTVTATPGLVAPSGLTATAGDSQVTLTWSAVPGASSYTVLRNGVSVGSVTAPTMTDTGLTDGTTYTYSVEAVSGGQTSSPSATVTATPAALTSLPAPTGLTATSTMTAVNLSWSAVTGATGYTVLRNGAALASTSSTSFADATALPGVSYSYTVQATTSSLTSSPSSAASGNLTPAAPTGLVATGGIGQVALSWTASSDAASYIILRAGTQIGTSTSPTFTDTTGVPGTTYSYTVVAVLGSATSAASTAATASATAPALAAPTGVTATSTSSLSTAAFDLTWTAVSGATSYSVYRDGTLLGTSTTASYTPTSTPVGATHVYTVMATNGNAAQNSPLSAPVTAGLYQGTSVNDAQGRTVYGQIQVSIVVTSATTPTITGCYATYPTSSNSAQINARAIPTLCSEVLTAQPTHTTASTAIAAASGASYTSPAFITSLTAALTSAGL